jgi:uncharacterized protein with PIN domain
MANTRLAIFDSEDGDAAYERALVQAVTRFVAHLPSVNLTCEIEFRSVPEAPHEPRRFLTQRAIRVCTVGAKNQNHSLSRRFTYSRPDALSRGVFFSFSP